MGTLNVLETLDNVSPLKELVSVRVWNRHGSSPDLIPFLAGNLGHFTLPFQDGNMMVESKDSVSSKSLEEFCTQESVHLFLKCL